MARIIEEDVRAILETGLEDNEINIYIEIANKLVNANLSNSGLSTDVMFEIERFWTAHLIASTRERQSKTESVGTASITYTGTYGEGLKSTSYGKMVETLDTSGTIAKLGKKMISMRSIKQFEE